MKLARRQPRRAKRSLLTNSYIYERLTGFALGRME